MVVFLGLQDAPFGLVVLPGSGGEGGANMGTMRWAQVRV
jgi:hypothetical protein